MIFSWKKNTKPRRISLSEALCSVLRPGELSELSRRCNDWRLLVEVAADIRQVEQGEILRAIAGHIGVGFEAELPLFDPRRLSALVDLDTLKNNCCSPWCSGDEVIKIAVVDPQRIEFLPPAFRNLPFVIAPRQEIERVIDQSLAAALKAQADSSKLPDMIYRLLHLIVSEVRSFGQSSALILFEETLVRYEFVTSRGRLARGTINEAVRATLEKTLTTLSQSQNPLLFEDGAIRAEIERVSGAVSGFTLRWRDAAAVEQPRAEARLEAALGSGDEPHILVIDDNATFCGVVADYLKRRGITVSKANNAQKALDTLISGEISPDLIICDVFIPGMGGIDFVSRLREDRKLMDLPVIMLSSDDQVDTQVEAFKRGADAYVPKHLDPRLLFAQVQRLLARSGIVEEAA